MQAEGQRSVRPAERYKKAGKTVAGCPDHLGSERLNVTARRGPDIERRLVVGSPAEYDPDGNPDPP